MADLVVPAPKMVKSLIFRYPMLEKINRWLELYPGAKAQAIPVDASGGSSKAMYMIKAPVDKWTKEVENWVCDGNTNSELFIEGHGNISLMN